MKYLELKALARRADRTKGEERRRLVEKLIRELPNPESHTFMSSEENKETGKQWK